MQCPTCDNPMITLELHAVEIDHCLSCGGIWLDRGELEQLIGDAARAGEVLATFATARGSGERPRRCPICRRRMAKIQAGSADRALLLDRCRRGDGLWFDAGELDTILEHARLDEDNRIRRLLADMFGRDTRRDS